MDASSTDKEEGKMSKINAISGSILATAIAFVSLLSPVSVHAGGAALAQGGFQVRTGSPALRTIEFSHWTYLPLVPK